MAIHRTVSDRDLQFDAFLEFGTKEMTGFQAKITYIGEQRKPLPTINVCCEERAEADKAKACAQVLAMKVPGIDFANDELVPMFCSASPKELAAVVQNLSNLPAIRNGAAAAKYDATHYGKYLVLSMYNKVYDEEFRVQSVLGQADAIPLLEAFGKALKDNRDCRDQLYILWRGLGFHVGSLDADSDGDGFSDGRELGWGTDPNNADSDGDGVSDSAAILAGRDPLNPIAHRPPTTLHRITEGPFAGSRIAQVTTEPDMMSGQATIEVKFTPQTFLPKTDNLVFVQIFRRTAVKADGFRIPIMPSLYIEYAGSPELDLLTIDGASVDHKVGELDPYYNGFDIQDKFAGAGDRQRAGLISDERVVPTAMLYRCRTYEEHWRALNPEGVREVQFDYETAAFCESGPGRGNFLGVAKWSWGKKRSGAVNAWLQSAEGVPGAPTGQVTVATRNGSKAIPVFLSGTPGQPSPFFAQVLSLWIKNHKFAWPGAEVDIDDRVKIVVPQPVAVNTQLRVRALDQLPVDGRLASRGFTLQPNGYEIVGVDESNNQFPTDYFPFGLPISVTVKLPRESALLEGQSLGVARFDERTGAYTTDDLYVLRRDPVENALTFCVSRFGKFAFVTRTH